MPAEEFCACAQPIPGPSRLVRRNAVLLLTSVPDTSANLHLYATHLDESLAPLDTPTPIVSGAMWDRPARG